MRMPLRSYVYIIYDSLGIISFFSRSKLDLPSILFPDAPGSVRYKSLDNISSLRGES